MDLDNAIDESGKLTIEADDIVNSLTITQIITTSYAVINVLKMACAKKLIIFRGDVLTHLVKNDISNIVQFATEFEDEFVKIVVDEDYKRIQATQKKNLEALNKMLSRGKELDTLCEKVFEEKILGNLPEDRFLKLSEKYENEQFEFKAQIKHMKKVVAEEKSHELNADGFLQIVRKYSNIEELTTEILHEFIDKIIVHHKEKVFGETIQRVEIYYKMMG